MPHTVVYANWASGKNLQNKALTRLTVVVDNSGATHDGTSMQSFQAFERTGIFISLFKAIIAAPGKKNLLNSHSNFNTIIFKFQIPHCR